VSCETGFVSKQPKEVSKLSETKGFVSVWLFRFNHKRTERTEGRERGEGKWTGNGREREEENEGKGKRKRKRMRRGREEGGNGEGS
jgi:hypothetical protein